MTTPTLPKFSLLQKSENLSYAQCDYCGRELKHHYLVRNNETNELLTLGSGCVKKCCGKTPSKIQKENDEFEQTKARASREEVFEIERKARISSFSDVDSEVFEYIIKHASENDFLRDMKMKIEEQGTIPENAMKAIRVMMIPQKEIIRGEKIEGKLEVLSYKFESGEDMWGGKCLDTTMFVRDESGEKFKVKTGYSKTNRKFVDEALYDVAGFENDGISDYFVYKYYPEFGTNFINVSGKFDGYKVSRAKISFID